MSYKSLVAGMTIADPKTDRKNAVCIDHYYVGKEAVYITHFFQDTYIPYGAVRKVWYQPTQLNVSCSCGKGLAVFAVCVQYDNGQGELVLQKYILEKEADAAKMVELIG